MIDRKGLKNTCSILRGEKQLEPLFLELKQYIEKEFEIKVYNIEFVSIKKNKFFKRNIDLIQSGKSYVIICHVSSFKDREKMQIPIPYEENPSVFIFKVDENKQRKIIDKMYELSSKHSIEMPDSKDQIWVGYLSWFESDYPEYVLKQVQHKLIRGILCKYKAKANIWRIYSFGGALAIFYFTDSDVSLNQENGITNEIRGFALSIINTIDDLKLYKAKFITFDSKENLKKNYFGNLFYYFR